MTEQFFFIFFEKNKPWKKNAGIGASPNPNRFAYKAVRSLSEKGYSVAVALGRKDTDLDGIKIRTGKPTDIGTIHTIALYMNSELQSIITIFFH
ncbi:MAG: CoA-binding protein [Bacteroidales bacterium]